MSTKLSILVLLVAALVTGSTQAADQVISIPGSWLIRPSPAPYSFSPDGIAVAAYKYKVDPPPGETIVDRSKVFQIVDGAIVSGKGFYGKVGKLEYSSDGQSLLVTELHPDVQNGARISFMDTAGTIIWTKDDSRVYSFSSTGEVVFAVTPPGQLLGRYGDDLEIFDLAGNSLNLVTTGGPNYGVTVLGAGTQVVVQTNLSILCLNVQSPPTTAWRFDLVEPDTFAKWQGFNALDSQRIVFRQLFGRFLVLSVADGSVVYRHDPAALAYDNPDMNTHEYSELEPFAQDGTSNILLFDKTADVFEVDVSTGEVEQFQINATTPPGAVVREKFSKNRIAILAGRSVTIRGPIMIQGQ